uniref:Uncharacterized protein n=1 Tax=Oncorhynchus tshawytscha TaxID=74940 RepID=A0A8C8FT91_ONCTS
RRNCLDNKCLLLYGLRHFVLAQEASVSHPAVVGNPIRRCTIGTAFLNVYNNITNNQCLSVSEEACEDDKNKWVQLICKLRKPANKMPC